jgi:hypothetical protein
MGGTGGGSMEYMEGEKREIEPLPPVDHSTIVYAPFRRCFYTEAPDVAAQTEEQAQQYLGNPPPVYLLNPHSVYLRIKPSLCMTRTY